MEAQLNLQKLQQLIKNGLSSIPIDDDADEAIIVIGDTGVGKSTIMNFLAGTELHVECEGLKPTLICLGESQIKIGHQKYSETSIPTRVHIENLAFYDCPGFRDNKGEEYEISNSFFVQKLLDVYPKVKIVLMLDQSHITESRADKLPRLTKNLLRSFKTFHGIKEGVIMIINRADPDFQVQEYANEIKNLAQLKNEKGDLFTKEEQFFLNYLADNERVVLFKQPSKKDKDKVFVPSESELQIMPKIKTSDFVKSRHISNIVSESAKIAIRDYIDAITLKSNDKIEKICREIHEKMNLKITKVGKQIPLLLQIKDQIMKLAQEVKHQQGENILNVIKRQLPESQSTDFEEDFQSIMFFKAIYDKTEAYFSNLVNKTYSQLSVILNKLDAKIIRCQKEQQEELQRQRILLKRKQIQNQREREKLETIKQLKQIDVLRGQIVEMGRSSHTMIKSLGDTLNFLDNLEQQFQQLRVDASKLKEINQDLHEDFVHFSQTQMKKAVA